MPFLVAHSSLGSSACVPPARCPHLSPSWSAPSKKCPPITSCPSITSTTCTEPDVSRRQPRAPPANLSYLAKLSLPPVPRYSAPLVFAGHRVAGARRPDRLAVELQVAVARRWRVRIQAAVHGSLRFGPQLFPAALEGREALSTTIDSAQL